MAKLLLFRLAFQSLLVIYIVHCLWHTVDVFPQMDKAKPLLSYGHHVDEFDHVYEWDSTVSPMDPSTNASNMSKWIDCTYLFGVAH